MKEQKGKVFEVRGNQSVEIIEGHDLTPGKKENEKYQESLKVKSKTGHTASPEPYAPKIHKAIEYKLKGVKPQRPHPRMMGFNTALESQNIALQERLYEIETAIVKLQGKKKC